MNEMKHNYWNHEIPSPQQVSSNLKIRPAIENLLATTSDALGLGPDARAELLGTVSRAAKTLRDESEFERVLKQQLVSDSSLSKLDKAVRERSGVIFSEIAEHFRGNSLLDVGCGNGLISSMSRPHFAEIQMVDVVNYVSQEVDLPFLEYREGDALPVAKTYDTVLLLTVLHHSNDPVSLLKEAWKATKQRLIIIESVFGVYTTESYGMCELAKCGESDQIAYATFVDWLYNRVLHDNIPVPFNFTTPERWRDVFSKHGMRISVSQNLGQDIKIAPEVHFLFVLER